MSEPTIGVAVITHCARDHLEHCLPPLLDSPLKPRVLVVNSSSGDGTVALAEEMGAETLVIPRAEFNHGTTREKARQVLGTDIVVMVTPDAYARNSRMLERLVAPIVKGEASVAYGRQEPHEGADFFEAFAREFNYPEESHIRGIEEIHKHGVYTFFCSNAFAAYANSALDEIGGFQPVLLGEDTIAVASLLWKGHKVAYVAEARVQHSHRYGLLQEFRRSFDTGLARKMCQQLIAVAGKDTDRGKLYVMEMLGQLTRERPSLIPYAIAQSAAKWLGYQIGRLSVGAPRWWKRLFSSQDFYWV